MVASKVFVVARAGGDEVGDVTIPGDDLDVEGT